MVEILDETSRFRAVERLTSGLEALLLELDLAGREVTVILIEDEAMAERNLMDRGVEGPTDVLSYPTLEPDDAGMPLIPHLGDIFIGLDVAERQALQHGHTLEDEVLVLAAHGLTHLRGLDHTNDEEWRPFLSAQERILQVADS